MLFVAQTTCGANRKENAIRNSVMDPSKKHTAGMSLTHCFLTTRTTDWKYFNILTIGRGTDEELQKAIEHLQQMITVAKE